MSKQQYLNDYWLKNSIAGLAVGILLGLYIAPFLMSFFNRTATTVIFAILVALGHQWYLYNKVLGKRRGEFEYEFQLERIDATVNSLIYRFQGPSGCQRYSFGEWSCLSTRQEEICKKLLVHDQVKLKDDNLYYIYMKLSLLAHKEDHVDEEVEFLKSAIELKPDDFLANYRAGVCFEKKGVAEKAIHYYQAALEDTSIHSEELKKYIETQVERVKKRGVMKIPPVYGVGTMG